MRQDALHSIKVQDLRPADANAAIPSMPHAQVRAAYAAWLKKRGFPQEPYGNYRFGKTAQTKTK